MIQVLGAFLFGIVLVLTVLIALGFPLGEFSMGGKYKIMPPKLRGLCWISAVIQLLAIVIILQAGDIMPLWFSIKTTQIICLCFSIYLSLNSIMNFFSTSKKEKYFATPLSILAAICFWITTFK